MEARTRRAPLLAFILLLSVAAGDLYAASFRTQNFICEAPTAEQAQKFCEAAERFRRDLAIEWLGRELPPWPSPCPITCEVGPRLGAGGATSFVFQNGNVHGWRMNVQGSEIRILDSVLPHEVTHTIFATHFRQPLPRWADEGACTTVEHPSEKARHHKLLITFLKTNRGIPFDRMFAMKEYPSDILPLYAQGHSLAKFLIAQSGKREFLEFVGDGMVDENWPRALRDNYGYRDLGELQTVWVDWVRSGSPLDVQSPLTIAQANGQGNVSLVSDPQPEPLPSDRRFDDVTLADNSPLTYAPQGTVPQGAASQATSPQVNVQVPNSGNAALPWRQPAKAGNAAASAASSPRPNSIYQAVRPQPPKPVQQRVLQ